MNTAAPLLLLAAFVCALALAVGNAAAPNLAGRDRQTVLPKEARAFGALHGDEASSRLARHHLIRWVVYKQEHRISTNLGRKVRSLRRDVRWLRQQLAHARRVAAFTSPSPAAAPSLPHLAAWLCIHRYEGAWDANTGNGYYGGLQMDIGFQQAYGSELLAAKGTADHWSPEEQMAVAERAYRDRGFYPWPNTARICGLI